MTSNRNLKKKDKVNYKHLSLEWYRNQNERDRKLFELVFIIFLTVVFLLLYTLSKDISDTGYHDIHGALFYCNIIIFFLFIIRRKDFFQIFKNTRKVFTRTKDIDLVEYTDTLFFGLGTVFVLSFLFVIDVSFTSNYGFRIGTVAAFGLISILRSVFISLKSNH